MSKRNLSLAAFLAIALPLAACGGAQDAVDSATDAAGDAVDTVTSAVGGGGRLDTVLSRGTLNCGVDGSIPGFSFVDESGTYSGLDVDVCRAVAAALFDDPEAVEYRRLDSTERFEALKGGEVDMLSRNTTWTISRDTSVGMEFAPTTFFDGQGMMVRADSGIETLEDMEGLSICVETGTTTELNLTDQFRQRGITFEPVVFQEADAGYAAYDEGRCDGYTSDKSQLLARRSTLSNAEEHVLLDVTMSKEPLGPLTINNDSAWFDTVKWVTYGLIQAEEFGLTADTVEAATSSEDPNILRFVGAEGTLGTDMGLPNDFMLRAIKHVGNYGEIFERNLGKDSQFELDRGQNALWTDGGLMYAPPFR
ncbi:MAG: amino acid ABC transporter substrate-binding protein [Cyanobacteria bacterium P01_H01_bin.105]